MWGQQRQQQEQEQRPVGCEQSSGRNFVQLVVCKLRPGPKLVQLVILHAYIYYLNYRTGKKNKRVDRDSNSPPPYLESHVSCTTHTTGGQRCRTRSGILSRNVLVHYKHVHAKIRCSSHMFSVSPLRPLHMANTRKALQQMLV